MTLSVIIPIYNVETYLRRCLNSIQQNKFEDFEVIMVDDGSNDLSGKIIDEYAMRFSNYHAFHKANGGLSDARNYGLLRAVGEYIWFVDGDDYITSGAIDEFEKLLRKNKSDVYCFTIEKHLNDKQIDFISYTHFEGSINGIDFLKLQYLNFTFRPEAWRNIYRKAFLLENGLFFEKGLLHEDDEWTPRVLVKADSIILSPFSAYAYVVRDNSIMKQTNYVRHIESIKFMIDKYANHDFGFDQELKLLVMDRMINNYISVFAKGKFVNEKKYYLPYSFFRDKIFFTRTRVKVLIFCLSKKLFCRVSQQINKRRGTKC